MITDYFNQSATLKRGTLTADTYGGYTEALSTVKTLSCLIQPISAWEKTINKQNQADVTHRMFTAYDSSILTTDYVVYGSDTFEIKEIIDPASRNHHLEIDLKKK